MKLTKTKESTVLITGSAGFIGFFLSKRLLEAGYLVIGIDNLNDYYSTQLKNDRLAILNKFENFIFYKQTIENKKAINDIFEEHKPEVVINLAAQAGVRYSIENPDTYVNSNLIGFFNIIEACRYHEVKHLIYASSSSVYGTNSKVPFEETDRVDQPVSLYAATKKANELMAHTYSHLYKIPSTGLRFFTVYGPMGRPDMAYFGFADKYFANESIHIFNNGDFENDLYRDFTYIEDIVEGIVKLIPIVPSDEVPHTVYNIGNNTPVQLMDFIGTLEKSISRALNRNVEFDKIYEPIKPGDVPATYADTNKLNKATGFKPSTSIKEGLDEFAKWYVKYYEKK